MNILNATSVFDEKYSDVRNRIQYIEICANYCIVLQFANLFSQFMYFALTTVQNMNCDRNQRTKKNEKKNKRKEQIIREEQARIDDGATDTWL